MVAPATASAVHKREVKLRMLNSGKITSSIHTPARTNTARIIIFTIKETRLSSGRAMAIIIPRTALAIKKLFRSPVKLTPGINSVAIQRPANPASKESTRVWIMSTVYPFSLFASITLSWFDWCLRLFFYVKVYDRKWSLVD